MPLVYIKEFKKGGGIFHSPNLTVNLHNTDEHPQWLKEYSLKVLELSQEPNLPIYPKNFVMKFKDKKRDEFLNHFNATL